LTVVDDWSNLFAMDLESTNAPNPGNPVSADGSGIARGYGSRSVDDSASESVAAAPGGDAKERILAAGAKLVGEKGFNGCGLNEILQLAAVPKGSFYHYFASKEDFGVALIERARDAYLISLRAILGDRRRTAVQRLRAVFEQTREECAQSGPTVECIIPKLALETANLSEPVHAAVRCVYQQWSALLAQAIREGQAAGEIDRRHDADRLANVLVMMWEGAAIRMQIDRSVQPLDDFLTFVFDSLLGDMA